jgi:hypothetical protein
MREMAAAGQLERGLLRRYEQVTREGGAVAAGAGGLTRA